MFYAGLGGWLAWERGLEIRDWGLGIGDWGLQGIGSLIPNPQSLIPFLAAAAGIAVGWAVSRPLNFVLGRLLALFDSGFRWTTGVYTRVVGMVLRVSVLVLVVYGGLLLLTYRGFVTTPKGFIPSQDMGMLFVSVQLPDAASAERTRQVMGRIQELCLGTERLNAARGIQAADGATIVEPVKGISHTVAMAGTSMVLSVSGSYFGNMFVILDDFAHREGPGLSAEQIAAELRKRCFEEIPDAMVTVLPPPPVRGVGRTGGFKLMIEDRGDLGLTTLQEQTDAVAETGRQTRWPRLTIAPNVFRANAPQLFVDMNRAQCITAGVRLSDAFNTLQVFLGSLYVNDFNLFGRTWQVVVQADARARNDVEKVRQLKVRNSSGSMVPMGTVADVREVNGPLILTRYNMYPAAAIQGSPVPGVSSRQAIDLLEDVSRGQLPRDMHYEWTELAYLELQAGNTAMMIFALAVVTVFLVLAAQYESWSLPLAVILVVPICLLAAITGVTAVPAFLQWFRGLEHMLAPLAAGPGVAGGAGPGMGRGAVADINIFTQIGFVVLVGLASKNAILIVQFAKRQRESGAARREAAITACTLRLRPIVMTSFAFILGVFPLLVGHGAGSEMRRTLGTAVFSGMLGVTLFGIFLTPVFFVVIDALGGRRLFQSRLMQRLRFFTLGVFALRFLALPLRLLADLIRHAWRKARRKKP